MLTNQIILESNSDAGSKFGMDTSIYKRKNNQFLQSKFEDKSQHLIKFNKAGVNVKANFEDHRSYAVPKQSFTLLHRLQNDNNIESLKKFKNLEQIRMASILSKLDNQNSPYNSSFGK